MKILDFQRHSANIRNKSCRLEKTTVVFLDSHKKNASKIFIGYSRNNQGILLCSVFPEHFFGIFPAILLGIFSEYTGNISWECSTNIPRTYICSVGTLEILYTKKIFAVLETEPPKDGKLLKMSLYNMTNC